MEQFKIGDDVEVLDEGLEMLQQFAPEGSYPNTWGKVAEIWDDGQTILVAFPIEGEDDKDKHSQVAPYPVSMVKHRNK